MLDVQLKLGNIMIAELPLVNSSNPATITPGTPVFLGERLGCNPMIIARCGHVIGYGEGTVKVYSPGYSSLSISFDKIVKEMRDSVCIYNSKGLYLMDKDVVGELNSLNG